MSRNEVARWLGDRIDQAGPAGKQFKEARPGMRDVRVVLPHGVSHVDYIEELEKTLQVDDNFVAYLDFNVLRGIYSRDESVPSLEPGMTRCEAPYLFVEEPPEHRENYP